jgi:hypothetical protein
LLKPSDVRGVLATVDKADVTKQLGILEPADFASVERGIADVLSLQPLPPATP